MGDQVARSEGTSASSTQEQDHQPSNRSSEDRNWSARIRASITRLMEVGISLDQKSYAQSTEKRKASEVEEAFHAKVDQLEVATQAAHKEYSERLKTVYSASTAKKMRLTSKESPAKTAETSVSRRSSEALETLVVAAATQQVNGPGASVKTSASKAKKTRRSIRRQNSPFVGEETGTERSPVQVHDPALTEAVDKLADKLTQLLGQLQTTSDTATAEPILAAAAAIALEATEMRRSQDVAMARMAEIEEHRQQIMQGLLEYEKRKEKQEMDEESKEGASGAFESRVSSSPPQDDDSKVDGKPT
ncbi:hypothetical protein V7S43_001635 [Phytophthora oleae]